MMNEKEENKPSKSNKRSPKALLPSISSDDIRRQYAAMFTNTFNSSDPEKFSKFLSERCTSDIKYHRTLQIANEEPNNIQNDAFGCGRDDVCQLWLRRVQVMPDFTMSVVGDGFYSLLQHHCLFKNCWKNERFSYKSI